MANGSPVTLKSTDGHPVRKSLTFRMSDSKHFLQDDDKASQNRSGGGGGVCLGGCPHFSFNTFTGAAATAAITCPCTGWRPLKKEPRGREKAGVRRTSVGRQWRLRVGLAPPAPSETNGHQTGRKSGREEEEGGGVEGGGDAGG